MICWIIGWIFTIFYLLGRDKSEKEGSFIEIIIFLIILFPFWVFILGYSLGEIHKKNN